MSIDDREPRWLAGLVGGLAGGLTMNMFARAAAFVGHGREAPGAAPGDNRFGRGAQPPQALHRANRDAAVLVGSAVFRAVAGRDPDPAAQLWLGTAMHDAFSAAVGVAYAAAASREPRADRATRPRPRLRGAGVECRRRRRDAGARGVARPARARSARASLRAARACRVRRDPARDLAARRGYFSRLFPAPCRSSKRWPRSISGIASFPSWHAYS